MKTIIAFTILIIIIEIIVISICLYLGLSFILWDFSIVDVWMYIRLAMAVIILREIIW